MNPCYLPKPIGMHTSFLSEPIEQHIRTYRSLLKSTHYVRIADLVQSHQDMQSLLHEFSGMPSFDQAAFTYPYLRLPACIAQTTTVLLAQSDSVFAKQNILDIPSGNRSSPLEDDVSCFGRTRITSNLYRFCQ
jgi:hypothetical protein